MIENSTRIKQLGITVLTRSTPCTWCIFYSTRQNSGLPISLLCSHRDLRSLAGVCRRRFYARKYTHFFTLKDDLSDVNRLIVPEIILCVGFPIFECFIYVHKLPRWRSCVVRHGHERAHCCPTPESLQPIWRGPMTAHCIQPLSRADLLKLLLFGYT